jgi:hypothetical protein
MAGRQLGPSHANMVARYGVLWLAVMTGRHLGRCLSTIVVSYVVPWLAAMAVRQRGPCLATKLASLESHGLRSWRAGIYAPVWPQWWPVMVSPGPP